MRLFIPTLGTVLTLSQDWAFVLHEERRNEKFANQKGLALNYTAWGRWTTAGERQRKALRVTLPKGTFLKVDRIYIRGKADDAREFDSVSFYCNPGARTGLRGRFWAKLDDVNLMEVAVEAVAQETLPLRVKS